MNFLAHYFVDREHPSSHFAIGAATPDLLSIYNERLRVKKHHLSNLDEGQLSAAGLELAGGLRRHFQADEAFHSSLFFVEETQLIHVELKEHFVTQNNQRKFFIAHVLLELLLDKVLIKNYPDLINEYYSHFANAVPFNEVRLVTEHISGHELPNYEHFLHKFLDNRYLTHYGEWDHITYVLGRILRRAGVDHPAFLDDPGFVRFLMSTQERLEGRYQQVFSEMKL